MVSKALVKRVRLSPQKARVVAKSLRGSKVESAVNNLKFSNTKASKDYFEGPRVSYFKCRAKSFY